jgi:hypothetical protein
MKLVSDWSRVLWRAWSIRFVIAAGVLSAVEVALPFFEPSFSPGIFAAASGLSAGAAFVARLVAQKGLNNGSEE